MPYLSSAQEVPLDFWATQEKVERMGVAAETKTITELSNPILRFSSDWKSMDHALLMLCYSVSLISCIKVKIWWWEKSLVTEIFLDMFK